MSDENEVILYHIICDISRICRNYFYERQHLPSDWWSIDDVVKKINTKSKDLKKTYDTLKKQKDN